MKNITIEIGKNGEVQASDLNLGRIGEHNSTKLTLSSSGGFFEGADYFRMSFGGFESCELTVQNGKIEYLVPSGATGSAIKSWQLTGYKFEGELINQVKKSQMVIFSLDQSVSEEESLRNKYASSIEADIQKYKELLSQLSGLYNELVAQLDELVKAEEGKGLSANDYSDGEKAKVAESKSRLDTLVAGNSVDNFRLINVSSKTSYDDAVSHMNSLLSGQKVQNKTLSDENYTAADKQAVQSAASAMSYKGYLAYPEDIDSATAVGIYSPSIAAVSSQVHEYFAGILVVLNQCDAGGTIGSYQYILGGKYNYYRYSTNGSWSSWQNSNNNYISQS